MRDGEEREDMRDMRDVRTDVSNGAGYLVMAN